MVKKQKVQTFTGWHARIDIFPIHILQIFRCGHDGRPLHGADASGVEEGELRDDLLGADAKAGADDVGGLLGACRLRRPDPRRRTEAVVGGESVADAECAVNAALCEAVETEACFLDGVGAEDVLGREGDCLRRTHEEVVVAQRLAEGEEDKARRGGGLGRKGNGCEAESDEGLLEDEAAGGSGMASWGGAACGRV